MAPIVVISFNRPAYLRETLRSLVAAGADTRRLFIFNDGARDDKDSAAVTASVEIANQYALHTQVFPSELNLGIAANFARAERYVFEVLESDCAYFFEDDLVVSPHYLRILDRLSDLARDNPRIGAFAAYGSHLLSQQDRIARQTLLAPMVWNWGFGLTREAWSLRSGLLRWYDEIVERAGYRARPFGAIGHTCRVKGFGVIAEQLEMRGSTSQDVMKKSALSILGAASVMTVPINATYIGQEGENFSLASFNAGQLGLLAFQSGGQDVIVESDVEAETRMGIIAQDGHSPAGGIVPTWLRDLTEKMSIDDLMDIYGLDETDRMRADRSHFLESLDQIMRFFPSAHRTISANRRHLAGLQAGFILSSSLKTLSVCFNKAQKSGFHYVVSPFFFSDFRHAAEPRFQYIEAGDVLLIDKELGFRDWLGTLAPWLVGNASVQACVLIEDAEIYCPLLESEGFGVIAKDEVLIRFGKRFRI